MTFGVGHHEGLRSYPPPDQWDGFLAYDAKAHPRKVAREFMLIPTTCFNCESACGLLAHVAKDDLTVTKLEGNPAHPGSRGRNCAKGPATINQVEDPERILYPLRQTGPRGSGQWERVGWDEALDDIAARIRKAILEDRRNEVMYHVGRPGEDGFAERFLLAWGVDGHNSHTNICSSGARLGYALWGGYDRPSPDHANSKAILLLSSHLETGHYFNPHAQRIMEGKAAGSKLVVIDPRMSNTASHADLWLAPWPGSEAAILLAVASHLLRTRQIDADYVRRWVNWDVYLQHLHPDAEPTFEVFLDRLEADYSTYTSRWPRPRRECRWPGSRSSRTSWPEPVRRCRRTSGAPQPLAISGAGRSPAACSSSTCSPAALAPWGAESQWLGQVHRARVRHAGRPHGVERADLAG